MEPVTLRPARPEDALPISRLVASAADLYQVAPTESFPLGEAVVAHWLRSRDGALVLEREGEVIGYAEINRDALQKNVWWISHVVLHPRWRRRGIGRELVGRVVAYAAETRRAHAVWLSVFQDNPSGMRTYRNAGFRIVGSRPVDGRELFDLCLDLQADERSISRRGIAILSALGGVLTLALLPGDLRAALVDDRRLAWWWIAIGAASSAALVALAVRPLLPRRSAVGLAPLGRPFLFGLCVACVLAAIWSGAGPLYQRAFERDLVTTLNLALQYGAGWGLVCTFLSQLSLRLHRLPASGPLVGQDFLPR